MIDPLGRWREHGEKPDYAGLLTFAGMPYTEDVDDLAGAEVAVVGAPMDELVSDRPGCRFGPRAIRAASSPPGQHLDARVDPFRALKVIDYGDAPVTPADPAASHEAIERTVADVVRAGAVPIILGGDHSISSPALRACHRAHGPLGLVHFDAHADTEQSVFGASFSHGTQMRQAVDTGLVDPKRYVQLGLRGYWPPPEVLAWQEKSGIVSMTMHEVRERGAGSVLKETIERMGTGPVFVTVDIDVLDPAFAPGTGTPEPGGMTSAQLLELVRITSWHLEVVGADIVEVAPQQVGSLDITALAAERVVRELLVGIALRRSDRSPERAAPRGAVPARAQNDFRG